MFLLCYYNNELLLSFFTSWSSRLPALSWCRYRQAPASLVADSKTSHAYLYFQNIIICVLEASEFFDTEALDSRYHLVLILCTYCQSVALPALKLHDQNPLPYLSRTFEAMICPIEPYDDTLFRWVYLLSPSRIVTYNLCYGCSSDIIMGLGIMTISYMRKLLGAIEYTFVWNRLAALAHESTLKYVCSWDIMWSALL